MKKINQINEYHSTETQDRNMMKMLRKDKEEEEEEEEEMMKGCKREVQ